MRKKIAVVTSSRADFGILTNLIKQIQKSKKLELQLIVSGSHTLNIKNSSLNEILSQNIKIKKILKINMKNNNISDTVRIYSDSLLKFNKAFLEIKPSLIVVLGDRFEILAAALSAYFLRIPIAHLHGGEITQGASDDAFRHAITKLSNFHFVTNKKYFKRVRQLGENPKNIFVVGSLGSENIKKITFYKKKEIEKKLKFRFKSINLLVTFHPVTLQKDYGKKDFLKILKNLKDLKKYGIIFTSPNFDVKNSFFSKNIRKFVKKNSNSIFINNMGKNIYFSTLKLIDCMIGNSSSGVLESAAFKLPVINVGDREKGRVLTKNVLSLKADFADRDFNNKLKLGLSPNFKKSISTIKDPNYIKNSSLKIIKIINQINLGNKFVKKFYDVRF